MTHLKIELNNGIIEEVSSAVIDKLYDIVHSGTLDNTSNLIGRLHTSATYQDYIDYLEDAFKVNGVKLLIIDATKKYMTFADPAVASYWANSSYGDGTGIDSTSAASVLSIPNDAFKNNTSIQSFDELGKFVNCTNIGNYAFNGCTNLTSIDLSNVTYLGELCFDTCSSLTNINSLNSLITVIKLGAFSNCSNLIINDVLLPNLTTLQGYAFNKTKVKQVSNLGSTISDIPDHCFYLCNQLTSVVLPSTVTRIRNSAFDECTSLTTINLDNVTFIELYGFEKCSLTSITNTSNITTISNDGFRESGLISIDLSGCTLIGGYSFYLCRSLTTVDLSNILTIGQNAFNGCTSLTTIGNTSTPTTINSGAFCDCSSLTSIDLSNITTLGNDTFNSCSSLTSLGDTSHITSIGNDVFRQSALTSIDLSSCTSLGNYAFYYCTSLSSLTNINNITYIGIRAFAGCTSLTSIDLSNVTTLSSGSFSECTNLTSIGSFSSNLTTLPTNCFESTGLTGEITIPASVTTLNEGIFASTPETLVIKFVSSTPPASINNTWLWNRHSNHVIKVPSAAVEAYKTAMPFYIDNIVGY